MPEASYQRLRRFGMEISPRVSVSPRSGSDPSKRFDDAGPSGPSNDPTSDLRKTLQPAVGMDDHGLADPLQEGAVTPIIRICDRIVHHNSVLLRPLFSPIPLSVPVAGRSRADPDEPTPTSRPRSITTGVVRASVHPR